MKTLSGLINNILEVQSTESYCGIFGESPSKGARSPILWNACFEAFNISAHFYPFDVLNDELEKLLTYLKNDERFLGGAVAVPHKEAIIPFLDCVEEEAKLIGAINLIYRKDGLLYGANTDGVGAVASVAEFLGGTLETFAKDKKVVLLGTGGTAKACAVYFAKCIGQKGHISIIGRNEQKAEHISEKCSLYSNSIYCNFDLIEQELFDTDFIVNCTVIGYENHIRSENKYFYYEPFTPLGSLPKTGFNSNNLQSRTSWLEEHLTDMQLNFSESFTILNRLKSLSLVMDVIYQPEKTQLLNLANMFGYKNLSGKKMNLLQAAFGFQKAFAEQNISLNNITHIMETV